MAIQVTLLDSVLEGGSMIIQVTVVGSGLDALAWSLKRADGSIVNGREDVSLDVADIDLVYTIVLQGDDLTLPENRTEETLMAVITATYDASGTYGADAAALTLPVIAKFNVLSPQVAATTS